MTKELTAVAQYGLHTRVKQTTLPVAHNCNGISRQGCDSLTVDIFFALQTWLSWQPRHCRGTRWQGSIPWCNLKVQCIKTPRNLNSSTCSMMSTLKKEEGALDFRGSNTRIFVLFTVNPRLAQELLRMPFRKRGCTACVLNGWQACCVKV